MLETIRTHSRVMMYILVPLIIGSFIFVGAESYQRNNNGGNATVATVGKTEIKQGEWDAHFRSELEGFGRQAPGLDLSMFDTPDLRRRSLDDMVRQRVYQLAAAEFGFGTTDERLLNFYRTDPQFAPVRNEDGTIDRARLQSALAQQGMSVAALEAKMREALAVRQVTQGVALAAMAPEGAASRALDAVHQQRELQIQRYEPSAYAAKVTPTDAEMEAFHKDPANAALFQTTEQIDIEYVVLDAEAAKKGVTVSEDDIKTYYEQNVAKRFTTPEERRVRHILIKAGASASEAERAAAKAKAEALRAELLKAPDTFADVARKNSQEPGTAERGGEFDSFVAKGDTEKSYENALFALKLHELSPVVATTEGFYIIQLQEVRGGTVRSYASAHDELAEELKGQLAQKRFGEASTEFANSVSEQTDGLKTVADRLRLEVKTAKGLTRRPAPGAEGLLASTKFLDALFANESLREKRNTRVLEVKPNELVSGRVVAHRPAVLRPLAEVKELVKQRLVARQSAVLAQKEGLAGLDAAKAAAAKPLNGPTVTVSRTKPGDVPPEAVDAALRVPESSFPAVVGVDLGERGYAVLRVTKVLGRDPASGDPKQGQSQYAQAWAQAETEAYYDALRARYKVKIKVPDVPAEKSATTAVSPVTQ